MANVTKKSVMQAWKYAHAMQERKAEFKGKIGFILWNKLARDAVKAYRDTLREYHEQYQADFDRVFNDRGENFTAYIILPSYIHTKEDANQYYNDWLEEHCTPSQYDCTGQRFNYLLGIQKRSNGRYGVYVRYCYDL